MAGSAGHFEKTFILKTATGILVIELHHLGGGFPDPDGFHQLARIKIMCLDGELDGKSYRIWKSQTKSPCHRLSYRFAEPHLSRSNEKFHHHQYWSAEEENFYWNAPKYESNSMNEIQNIQ